MFEGMRSTVGELRSQELRWVHDEGLEEDFVELTRASQALEAERLRRLAEIQRRATFARDGYLSAVSWLKDRLRMGGGEAADQVRVARSLACVPEVRDAYGSGDISRGALRVLVSARDAHPADFARSEGILVKAARSLPDRQLSMAVGHWRDTLDAERALEDAESIRERRRLHVSETIFGMVRVDGDLDPETGATVVTALRAVMDAAVREGGEGTPAQRRADALGEICRGQLDREDRPEVAGERPHLNVTVDLESLEGRAGRRCELEHAGRIHPETARRMACDAGVSRVITAGRSEPLDVGRRTPVVPAALRRALVVRDGGCRFPGCDRPQAWCDAHHLAHWADGGPTALANLALLCRPHHRLLHEGRFRAQVVEGSFRWLRPDGSSLEDRAPPVRVA